MKKRKYTSKNRKVKASVQCAKRILKEVSNMDVEYNEGKLDENICKSPTILRHKFDMTGFIVSSCIKPKLF